MLARLSDDHLAGRRAGLFAVCSANRFVLDAAMKMVVGQGGHLLIEATANQVNQFGGYMGMTPDDYRIYIDQLSNSLDIDRQRITPRGAPRQIDDLIREEVKKLGSKEGGLMMVYGLYPGVPVENIRALMDAMERYSTYYS